MRIDYPLCTRRRCGNVLFPYRCKRKNFSDSAFRWCNIWKTIKINTGNMKRNSHYKMIYKIPVSDHENFIQNGVVIDKALNDTRRSAMRQTGFVEYHRHGVSRLGSVRYQRFANDRKLNTSGQHAVDIIFQRIRFQYTKRRREYSIRWKYRLIFDQRVIFKSETTILLG